MWPLLLGALFALLWAVYLLTQLQRSTRRKRALEYRTGRLALLATLEGIAAKLSALASLVPYVKVGETALMDAYEAELRMFESTLTAAQGLASYGFTPESVRQLAHVAATNERRVQALHERFRHAIEGRTRPVRDYVRWTFRSIPPVRGCYFCSRPYDAASFKVVRSWINGVRVAVYGCDVCRAELDKEQSAKVLHFMVKGQPVHWEQVRDYSPLEDFWDLNRRKPVYRRPTLQIIRGDEPR